MIFVTVGSQKFQFNRLLKAIDMLVKNKDISEEVFAQIGYSDYYPQNFNWKKFLDREEFIKLETEANIVVTHGGTGAIVGAIKKRKKVIAIPRLSRYGEHVDDHQTQIINEFQKQNLIYGLKDCNKLLNALEYVKSHKFNIYTSNTKKVEDSIERFIKEEFK